MPPLPPPKGPADWSPDRFRKVELERLRTLKLERSMAHRPVPKPEYMEWLMGIPLATSAAGVNRSKSGIRITNGQQYNKFRITH